MIPDQSVVELDIGDRIGLAAALPRWPRRCRDAARGSTPRTAHFFFRRRLPEVLAALAAAFRV